MRITDRSATQFASDEIVTVDATSGTMTLRYQVYRGPDVVATGVAVFERE